MWPMSVVRHWRLKGEAVASEEQQLKYYNFSSAVRQGRTERFGVNADIFIF
jgi:hypothetical protein